MKLSKTRVMLVLAVCVAILAVATAVEAAEAGSKAPFLRNRRALLGAQGAQYGPDSYRAGGYGRNWGYGGYYGGYMRYPSLPDPVRMDTSSDRRFAMIQ
ncbi:hypothetical protein COO60DRAFT_1546810 [Scenedesmus sp. NREL 46B-D3]|nr:hypothetical protein COO60DRAFT_1546810 [Scenedesmus sp. NREL 46B-D3]